MIKENIRKRYSVHSRKINWIDAFLQDAAQLFKLHNIYFIKISQKIVIYKSNTKYQ